VSSAGGNGGGVTKLVAGVLSFEK
jgi:hypothetical protein